MYGTIIPFGFTPQNDKHLDDMLFPRAVVAAAVAPFAAAAAAGSHHRMHAIAHQEDLHNRAVEMWRTSDAICGFTNPHQGSRMMSTVQRIQSAEDADDILIKAQKTEPITITVNLHAALPANVSDCYVSEKQLEKQFRVLQEECTSPLPRVSCTKSLCG